ncbi:MAG TPA: DNA double-strand break repair nuclease NurA, partial [Anaerolineales bacterium]|nr:DNA double-strand break repair nuclease NurA [Anaerolineales bacterium]
MALELNKLTAKIGELGKYAAVRNRDLDKRVEIARTVFRSVAAAPGEIVRVAESVSKRFRWAGAIPTEEPMLSAFDPVSRPARLNVVAADGSQIQPDRHNLALYYVINIGSIVFRYGVSSAPDVFRHPDAFFEDEELYYEDEGSLMTTEMINARRDVREIGELARLGGIEMRTAPTVALLDNGLLLYISLREQNPRFGDEIVREYLAQLYALKASGAVVAGVVDRPRSANVVRLVHLAGLEEVEIAPEKLREVNRVYKHVTDASLFNFLGSGQRSAVFVL